MYKIELKNKIGDEVWFMWGKQLYSSEIRCICIHEDGITYGIYYGLTHGSISADKTYNSKEELLKSLQK